MIFNKKLMLTIVFTAAGVLLFILTGIYNTNPISEVITIILFFSATVTNYKWHRIRWLHVLLVIILMLLFFGFLNNIFFKYPELGTVIQE